ncbi:MAG TPA: alkaline phosphatase family protein [Solirubrobacteraceae bacterium]|nr:alkaline phosphatase family protein [Solirubrobacteraceae bacterium]
MSNLVSKTTRRLARGRVAIALALVSCVVMVGVASAAIGGFNPFGDQQVSQTYANGILLPTNQWISPLGKRILDNEGTGGTGQVGARLVSSTISPDGQYLAALGWNNFQGYLTIVDLKTGTIVQQTALNGDAAGDDPTVAADGPLFTPGPSAGTETLWVPQSEFLQKYSFDDSTGAATPESSIFLCGTSATSPGSPAGPGNQYCSGNVDAGESGENSAQASLVANGAELPSGMALSPDGSKLYVALNGANKLGVIDTANDTVLDEIPVGNAPRQVELADNGTVAYVSNEGGRPANSSDRCTNLSDGTPIVSNCSTGGAVTGTVSVVNLSTGKETEEIPVGLQPTALYQDGDALFVANSNDDSMSVIDEQTNTVTQTVRTNPVPGATVGSYANAINMADPNHVLVSIGRDNAIAEYRYDGPYVPMRFVGLLPTDWYPVQVQPDPALGPGTIVVTNDKGIGAQGPIVKPPPTTSCTGYPSAASLGCINKGPYTEPVCSNCNAYGHNTYQDTGSVTTFTMPTTGWQIGRNTQTVFTDNDWNQIRPINQGDYDTVPRVIPPRLGGSSPIKHIVVIVRENRTYDQVLGDITSLDGQPVNGDPADAQFGAQITPNAHALAERFGDLDNFYDEGTLSADGHNWIVQAEATDYVEKQFGAFYRSYPSQAGDALAYQRDGFLWNAAEKAGLSVQNFGEYIYNPYRLPALPSSETINGSQWDSWYAESQWLEDGHKGTEPISNPCQYTAAQSDIPSLQAITDVCFPNFQLSIPDQYRVDQWLPVFQQQEQSGKMPNLTFMWLMTDHTSGSGVPDPVAQVADNDLAVGRVIDTISHSKFWKSTAIFIVEDDTQNGVDHVDGHRGPAFVISPYSAPGVDNDYYTQLNMVKTIEQILGIHAMNQEDLAAEPMYDAFTDHPSRSAFQPYTAEPNQIPLYLGAPGYPSTLTTSAAGATPAERSAFRPQGVVPADMESVYKAWEAWNAQQGREGHFDGPDKVNPQQLNRFDWYSAHDWRLAYPGDPKIYLPDKVPGRSLPAAYLGDD